MTFLGHTLSAREWQFFFWFEIGKKSKIDDNYQYDTVYFKCLLYNIMSHVWEVIQHINIDSNW